MAIYLVKSKDGSERLVSTRTKAGAINFVAAKEYEATPLKGSALVKALKSGLELEEPEEKEEGDETKPAELPMKNAGNDAAAPAKAAEAAKTTAAKTPEKKDGVPAFAKKSA